jgi:molecular chaperone HtpG
METDLYTHAEKQAEKAQRFEGFSSINLLGIKKGVAQLLGLIGRDGIFDQYTVHNISHINKMLSLLDWLIPDETKSKMTPADWLMVVLSIYFHDLGLLVTPQEYDARDKSGFPRFLEQELFVGDSGKDYRAKVEKLPPERAERFLYQEYVRNRHATRIKAWISGESFTELGIAHQAADTIQELLHGLTAQFRRDLALICESHHLEELYDVEKYKLSQPYGDSDAETVNLQYGAVLLRTADLLHITSDRTPSVMFKSINPADPLSQEEWAKQMAVRRVRSQLGVDREGNRTEDAPRDTIEIHAFFENVTGFFGLTSYLTYASEQLRKSAEWIRNSEKLGAVHYKFPWRYIDDSHIETKGFLRNSFEFTIDQAKILDLLTGHTLYNDSSVVLRELAQNAIDAVRLKRFESQKGGKTEFLGDVKITWSSGERVLQVADNGTGMTQRIIEDFLLKVGSSRYQDPEFKKEHPGFSPISRFGIGVLSTFMVADEVEILTCHPSDAEARHLSLRSVHGKYLIRLIPKDDNFRKNLCYPHGTIVTLKLRPSATIDDIFEIARHWIVLPDCTVTVAADSEKPVRIGFESVKDAVKYACDELGAHEQIKIYERTKNNVTVAYATRWSEYFRQYEFVTLERDEVLDVDDDVALGTCVSGVRVDEGTPGFNGKGIIAIANATGVSAPKTNVARSGLENTPQLQAMLETVYQILCGHIAEQVDNLQKQHGFSLTWANQEWRYLLAPLLWREETAINEELLYSVIKSFPVLLVEHEDRRFALAPAELQQYTEFWTVDSAFFDSAEFLIREIPSDTSLARLGKAMNFEDITLPKEPVLCGSLDTLVRDVVLDSREVSEIAINRKQRRVDLKWVKPTITARWYDLFQIVRRQRQLYQVREQLDRFRFKRLMIPRGSIEIRGSEGELGVSTAGATYLLPGSRVAGFIKRVVESNLATGTQEDYMVLNAVAIAAVTASEAGTIGEPREFMESSLRFEGSPTLRYKLIKSQIIDEFVQLLGTEKWKIFSPSAWERKNDED